MFQWEGARENLWWPLGAKYPVQDEVMPSSCLGSYCIRFSKAWISDSSNSLSFLTDLWKCRKLSSSSKTGTVLFSSKYRCQRCLWVLQRRKMQFCVLVLPVQSSETYQQSSVAHYTKRLMLQQYQSSSATTYWETWIIIINVNAEATQVYLLSINKSFFKKKLPHWDYKRVSFNPVIAIFTVLISSFS